MVRFSKCAKVKTVKVLDGFQVRVRFHDGCVKIIDLKEVLLPSVGLAKELLEDRDQFQTVHVAGGTLCWANGFDICSDVLRHDLKTTWLEEHPEFKTARKSYLELPDFCPPTRTKIKQSTGESATKSRATRSRVTTKKSSPRA